MPKVYYFSESKMSELHKKLHLSKLPPMPPPAIGAMTKGGGGAKRGISRKRDYTPVSWDTYYDRMEDVEVSDTDTFRVYENGTEGPVCFFLHGGGFSALSWAVLSNIVKSEVNCRCAAMDFRGHGDTYTSDDQNLSAEIMASDVANVIHKLYGEDAPPIILIGHSMGGAIAVHTAHKNLIPSLIGLIVIDVVEGTALDALSSMQSFLRGRPNTFKQLENAIEWCVRSGQVRNLESARVSMVGQVKQVKTNKTATSLIETQLSHEEEQPVINADAIPEEDEMNEESSCGVPSQSTNDSIHPVPIISSEPFTWRINLCSTEKYWRGWFEGLSSMFLSCTVPKMLLLAGVDRLDKELTVGQMQGKFQMQVLPQCGHAVHEDAPDKVADVLATFMVRNKFAEAKENFHRTFPAC